MAGRAVRREAISSVSHTLPCLLLTNFKDDVAESRRLARESATLEGCWLLTSSGSSRREEEGYTQGADASGEKGRERKGRETREKIKPRR